MKLFVANLVPGTLPSDLEKQFQPYGDIQDVVVVPGRGFGFVFFENEADAKFCVESFAQGKSTLTVEFAGKPAPQPLHTTPLERNEGGQKQPNRKACTRLWLKS